MESCQEDRHGSDRMLGLGADEDREQQHGGNAMVLKAREEGGKNGLVESKPAQGELDQGDLAPGKLAQEEPTQLILAQEATGVAEEAGIKEAMGGGHAGDGSFGPVDSGEGGHGSGAQQQPQQEAAMPEGSKSLRAGNRQPLQRRTRFTLSQLQDLEHLFQETRYPSLRARKDLARWMGVSEADVQDWFRNRRALFRRNNRLSMLSDLIHDSQNDDA
ncbi:rhox homeobox family member 2-like [Mesocricetus auratus]|uniref:Rhox homeobox family member 2-like n=1 Tax=Mesocricetus auratus TaxID=10036 RepID=A0ABM2XAG0_MESAU|nr:rhox homeobox family member 2-like [Mesocricetus auratus]XP_040599817.1 rhox homeobox family member 2-like [Mesocricetus auratus]